MRTPNFENLLAVLRHEAPERPTLFEFFLNGALYQKLAGMAEEPTTPEENRLMVIKAFMAAGYDYCTMGGSDLGFPAKAVVHQASRSMSDTPERSER